jgi:hypothetical protein
VGEAEVIYTLEHGLIIKVQEKEIVSTNLESGRLIKREGE